MSRSCILHDGTCRLQPAAPPFSEGAGFNLWLCGVCDRGAAAARRVLSEPGDNAGRSPFGELTLMEPFNLAVWLPALFLLGAVTMALLFAFIIGCDKV